MVLIYRVESIVIQYFILTQGADDLRSDGTVVLTVGPDDEFLSRLANGDNNHWKTFEEALFPTDPNQGIKARFNQIIDQYKRNASTNGRGGMHEEIQHTAEGARGHGY